MAQQNDQWTRALCAGNAVLRKLFFERARREERSLAKAIIEAAQCGARDPIELGEQAKKTLGL